MKQNNSKIFGLLFWMIIYSSVNAHVTLDYPQGGETFIVGETITIQWHITIAHNQENWDLYFSPDGGSSWNIISEDLPVSRVDYLWIVPEEITDQGRIKIYMDNTAANYEDVSNNFTIQAEAVAIQDERVLPQKRMLYQNHPNPFNPSTSISYDIPEPSDISLAVYDTRGRTITMLQETHQSAGSYTIIWNGMDGSGNPVSAGIYFARFQSGTFSQTIKMVYLR
ncbi:T9SS type A sorting domain-containing protein [bacterium]|nr:T9SS type A sorting domain-containing protein [bacterium]